LVNFADAVSTVFKKYATFGGRARRSEYWWFTLFDVIAGVVAEVVDAAAHTVVLQLVVFLALLLPGLAVTVRRLHDTGRTGWWWWILLVPLAGAIVMLVFLCQDSQHGPNKYGESPKYPGPQGPYGSPWSAPGPYGAPGYGPVRY
jgi:uncharacterized membrane protein YhaH (DUF805 family)